MLRADDATPIIIGDECNIQDGVVFHGLKGNSTELGKRVSIAHGAVIHGPLRIGNESFVGFNVVVHNSSLEKRCFVGHGELLIGVKPGDGKFVPHGTLIDSQKKADALDPVPESLKHVTTPANKLAGF
ncbi:MAG: hypothetical protein MUO26_11665 [Methanotrichaceae archaeon]|nr:hypothetical protein [Methanotrichaceae archaeon]